MGVDCPRIVANCRIFAQPLSRSVFTDEHTGRAIYTLTVHLGLLTCDNNRLVSTPFEIKAQGIANSEAGTPRHTAQDDVKRANASRSPLDNL